MTASWVRVGESVHEAERQGLAFLADALPDGYFMFSNVELPTGRRGQFYEHDAVVVAPHAVFTIELKSWGGRITGNRDRWTMPGGFTQPSPLGLQQQKARTLKGLLERKDLDLSSVWVQGLVFLSAPDAEPRITDGWADLVCTRATILDALTNAEAWNIRGRIDARRAATIFTVLADNRAPSQPSQIGDYKLLQRLDADDAPYDAWLAEAVLTHERRVLHVHPIDADDATSREKRLERALREATLHGKLRGGPDLLVYESYFTEAGDPRKIVLVFEDTTPFVALPTWISERNPGLQPRLKLGARIARALAWVHDRDIVHRRLSADAVLVSPEDDAARVRLCAFELAHEAGGRAPTITSSSGALRFSAPEVVLTGEATAWSDRFALGASLVEVLLGRSLFPSVEALLRPLSLPTLMVGDRPVPADVQRLIERLLSRDPQARPTPLEAAEILERATGADALTRATDLAPDVVLRQTYRLEQTLGRGATATTWRATQVLTGQPLVLKIAAAEHVTSLRNEATALGEVRHPNVVAYRNFEADGADRYLLVLDLVEGAAPGTPDLPAARDPVAFRKAAAGLLHGLEALHAHGWLHRDVKPANVLVRAQDGEAVLLDLGLARRVDADAAGALAVGTPRYKDPLVYTEERWTAANDLYAAFLVLWELLTGLHPFPRGPELDRAPALSADDLHEAFGARAAALVDVFKRALSPARADRPATPRDALRWLDDALPKVGAAPGSAPEPHLPTDARAEDSVDRLALSTRGMGALARLQLTTVGDLAGLTGAVLDALPNVGRKTREELLTLATDVRTRWPDLKVATVTRPAARPFFPALRDDDRPLTDLGQLLHEPVARELAALGVRTVGQLAALPTASLASRRGLSAARLEDLRRAMLRLSGADVPPPTLDDLADQLRDELEPADFEVLAALVGLVDGAPKLASEVSTALGASAKRVARASDLDTLRKPGSAAVHLLATVRDLLPAAGFASLTAVGAALQARMPGTVGRADATGFARLAALLMRPDATAADAPGVDVVLRPPWTEAMVQDALAHLATRASWPPVPRDTVANAVWDVLGAELQATVVRAGADAGHVLEALLGLQAQVQADPGGDLFSPPVALHDALARLRKAVSPSASVGQLIEEAQRAFGAVTAPEDPAIALKAAGFRRDGDVWSDPDRVPLPEPTVAPELDSDIPRQHLTGEIPALVQVLTASAPSGGVRVVAFPPGRHHALARTLTGWLASALGDAQVRFVDVDRVVMDSLKASGMWPLVALQEKSGGTDWRWLHDEAKAGIDAALKDAKPGVVTVLARPSLLGTLGLLPWLSGWYEKARGGRYGLIVLAVPGGIHEQRVKLNGKYPFPYTPDMAGIYLEDGA